MSGYHIRDIERGVFGEASKIREETEEFLDAVEQGVEIMALIELSDLIGAIEEYAVRRGSSLDALIKMKTVTRRAFEDGTRDARAPRAFDPSRASF